MFYTSDNTNYTERMRIANNGTTISGVLNLTGTPNNPLFISSTSTSANNCIQIKYNSTYTGYIGIGGTAMGGNYANNFFIESAFSSIIFNTNGRTSTSTPNMIVHSSGKVGIGNDNPQSMLHIGNSDVVGSAPVLLFGKNNGSGSRNAFMGYADSFFFCFW